MFPHVFGTDYFCIRCDFAAISQPHSMILEALSIVNYKNLSHAELHFSPNVNCFIGNNGMGKTNILDAIYYLSFGKSATSNSDAHNIRHDEEFFMLQGQYRNETNEQENISCAVKRGQRKRMRRNDKEYKRLSEHVGVIPLVMLSPSDSILITGGSEERRRFLDSVLAQISPLYLEALLRYNKNLQQRNALLKLEEKVDEGLFAVIEEMMSEDAALLYAERQAMVSNFLPIFQAMYARLCNQAKEQVEIHYESHAERGDLLPLLQEERSREQIVGYTLRGPHKDNLQLLLNGHDVRREGSQGQMKSFFIAMKLAQFLYLKSLGRQRTPILLLDDIFDKLDAGRVACIVDYVSGEDFGQIFITDTNRDHLDRLLSVTTRSYQLFGVVDGQVETLNSSSAPLVPNR